MGKFVLNEMRNYFNLKLIEAGKRSTDLGGLRLNGQVQVLVKLFQELGISVDRHPRRLDITSAMEQLRSQYPDEMKSIWTYLSKKIPKQ
jgi:hypothetical protein